MNSFSIASLQQLQTKGYVHLQDARMTDMRPFRMGERVARAGAPDADTDFHSVGPGLARQRPVGRACLHGLQQRGPRPGVPVAGWTGAPHP